MKRGPVGEEGDRDQAQTRGEEARRQEDRRQEEDVAIGPPVLEIPVSPGSPQIAIAVQEARRGGGGEVWREGEELGEVSQEEQEGGE